MNENQTNQQTKYTEEYVHYLEQSVLELTERIIALEEELSTLKTMGISTMIEENENQFQRPSIKR